MTKYDFSLVLKGIEEIDDDLADALFAAGCDDGTPGSCDGVTRVDFHREADSLEEALRSAVANVQAAGCVVSRVEIEPDAAVLR
jgi:hypothetical protein